MEAAGIKLEQDRPTLLVVGDGEPMDVALRAALERHRLTVETTSAATVIETVFAAAPDLVLLVGDAAVEGGVSVLSLLASNPATAVVPVAVLSDDTSLDRRMRAFRHGAVALVPREASVDAVGKRVAELVRELPERSGEETGELGEATLDELVELVRNELKTGILSVEQVDHPPAMRIFLGAGKPVQEVLTEFVERLKPLIERAEPLRYELLEDSAGRLQLLDGDDGGEADLAVLAGLRVLVVDDDPGRADALAQELRARNAMVAVTDVTGRGLERARVLDPAVVIVDASGLEGPGFEVVRTLRRDPHLRWAQLLVASFDEIWPDHSGRPDIHRLAYRITPLVEQDEELRERAEKERSFDTRLEVTGPSRLLRALAAVPGPLHVTVRSAKAVVEVDLAEGLVVGARAVKQVAPRAELEGSVALAAMLVLSSGRVRVEHRRNPSVANIMAPVDEAIAGAAAQSPPIQPSIPPEARAREDNTAKLGVPKAPAAPPVIAKPAQASRRRTTPGVPPAAKMPPKLAAAEAPTPSVKSPTDDAPTIAPPPAAIGDAFVEQDTVLDAPALVERDDATVRTSAEETERVLEAERAAAELATASEQAASVELADGPHPSGAPSIPITVESVSPEPAPRLVTSSKPVSLSFESEQPKPRNLRWVAVLVALLVAAAAGSVAAVALVPGIRQELWGEEPRPPVTAESDPDPDPDPEADPDPDPDPETGPETETEAEAEAEAETGTEAEAEAEGEVETEAEAEPETAPEAVFEITDEHRALSANGLVARGTAALREERLAEAEALYRLALEKDRRENHAMAGLAEVFIARNDAAQAIEWAERAVNLRRRRAAYRVVLGDAYRIAGRTDDARREYYTALREEPRNPQAQRGLQALRE